MAKMLGPQCHTGPGKGRRKARRTIKHRETNQWRKAIRLEF